MPLDFCVAGEQPVRHEIIFLLRPPFRPSSKAVSQASASSSRKASARKCSRNILANRVSFIAMYPALALFQIDRVRRQVPVGDGVAVMMKIKTLLPHRG